MAEMTAAEYRAMALGALKIATTAAEHLDAKVTAEAALSKTAPIGPTWEAKLEAERYQREMSIALVHAGVYANLATSKGSEQGLEQLKDLAIPIPAPGPAKVPLHLRVLRRWWKVPTLRERLGR